MTMHLVGPWLSTTGKRKGKVKFASAEAKQKSEQLDKEWKELLKRQGIEQDDRKRQRGLTVSAYTPPKMNMRGAELLALPSHNTGIGIAVKADVPMYTGSQVVGIVVQHKSCLQPVFSQEAAEDSASMRR